MADYFDAECSSGNNTYLVFKFHLMAKRLCMRSAYGYPAHWHGTRQRLWGWLGALGPQTFLSRRWLCAQVSSVSSRLRGWKSLVSIAL